MKMNLCKMLCAALVLLLGSGCEKDIDFKGEQTEPRLTVSAQAEVGEPLSVYVASSIFFLQNDRGGRAFMDGLDTLRGQVRCFVNGAKQPHVLTLQPRDEYASALPYLAEDYSPAPGDRIRLEAEFPGFDPVWAETSVPRMPAFEIVSAKWHKESGTEEWGWDYYDLDMTMAVTDDGSYDKYYFLQPVLQFSFNYGDFFEGYADEVQFQSYGFSSNDVLFRELGGGKNALQMIDEESNYFSDALIKGQRHEFTITVSMLPEKEESMRMWVHTATVNESLYWYDYSYSRLGDMNGLFSEGVTLYSNVNGGYGVFCAAASQWLEVEW